MRNYFIGFIVLIIVLLLGYHFWTPVNFDNIKYVKIAGQEVKVDLATTSFAQERGLSGRSTLGENEGMLFIFDKPNRYSFWTKDMNFPIDIVWFGSARADGENMKVVYIKKEAKPESYPETYGPDTEAKYVLEVMAGFSDKNNLKVGDEVEFR